MQHRQQPPPYSVRAPILMLRLECQDGSWLVVEHPGREALLRERMERLKIENGG